MNIYSAISAVMDDMGAIGKGKKNAQQGFMYRGIDDVMNTLQPLLVKHKVFAVPEIMEQHREERVTGRGAQLIYTVLTIKYTFFTEDGSCVSAVVIGEGMDSGDKSSNKAMSVAFKYACFQVFCIPTEEMKDPDAETPEPSRPAPHRASKPVGPAPDASLPWDEPIVCEGEGCGRIITPIDLNNGGSLSPERIAQKSRDRYGKVLCPDCAKKMKNEDAN